MPLESTGVEDPSHSHNRRHNHSHSHSRHLY
jgi:hypothetical protein